MKDLTSEQLDAMALGYREHQLSMDRRVDEAPFIVIDAYKDPTYTLVGMIAMAADLDANKHHYFLDRGHTVPVGVIEGYSSSSVVHKLLRGADSPHLLHSAAVFDAAPVMEERSDLTRWTGMKWHNRENFGITLSVIDTYTYDDSWNLQEKSAALSLAIVPLGRIALQR